jgi:hypothetical protein
LPIAPLNAAASAGCCWYHSKISQPSAAGVARVPVRTAVSRFPQGSQWPGDVCAIARSRIDPGTFERSVPATGVSAKVRGAVSLKTPKLESARRRRKSAPSCARVSRASTSTVLGPSARRSASASFAATPMACARQ